MDYTNNYDVRDNGRRGEPLPGCGCMRCFGRCIIDRDVAHREIASPKEVAAADAIADESDSQEESEQ